MVESTPAAHLIPVFHRVRMSTDVPLEDRGMMSGFQMTLFSLKLYLR